ncbi:MAG TPA: transketolase C-terminal domain-containing protein [Methanomassiliicoccales archaeon]|nr:transketolase C-terminal domain-containing protein [Methanomassiliicoccales archaeon]HQM66893.1 transketolase C-terminal domain-containing protein [Methanomassiliicoccales archaeon]
MRAVRALTGNAAAAYGVKLCRPEVIPNYPITPQTIIIEQLADFINDGELDADFIPADSEHSAMSIAIGAAATGVRTFTATASHGLALMHEMLYAPPQLRLPILLVDVNRSLGAGSGIWVEYNDSMPERDSGWMQAYAEDAQEVLDMVIQAYRIAEDPRVVLPFMLCLDGFILSHTVERVEVPGQEEVDAFLPRFSPLNRLDPEAPMCMNMAVSPTHAMEMRYQLDRQMEGARQVIAEVDEAFGKAFGRSYGGLLDTYLMEDAEVALITLGTATSTARVAVDELRAEGRKVGLIKLRFMRPFPHEELREAVKGLRALGVFDRSVSFNRFGPVFTEVRSSLYGSGVPITDHIAGIGGRDLKVSTFRDMFALLERSASGGRVRECTWHGLRGEM